MGTMATVVVAAAVVLLGVADDPAQQQEKIRYRRVFEKGWSYTTHRTVSETFVLAAAGKSVVAKQKTEHVERSDVESVDQEGNAWVRYTLEWVRFEGSSPTGQSVYDSRTEDFPQWADAQALAALVGQSYRVKLSPQGQVIAAEGLEELNRRVAERMPDGPQAGDLLANIGDMFCLEGLKEVFDDELAVYPEGPVGIGDWWDKKVVWRRVMPLVREKSLTLKQRRDGVAVIEVLTTVTPNLRVPPKARSGVLTGTYLSGREKDTIRLDESDGHIVQWDRRQWLSGVKATEFVENLSRRLISDVTVQGIATVKSEQLEIRLLQQWLAAIRNRAVDINDVLDYVALPFSFDGKLITDSDQARERFADLRTLLNNPPTSVEFGNFRLLTTGQLQELLGKWQHRKNYLELSERADCMACFDARMRTAETDEENTDTVYIGFDADNKIISWFD